jgi:Mg2+ and Co2+ transporter CorA
MLAETDIRNKDKIVERKSMVSQMQGQLQSIQELVKEKDGTIETLQRQLVQAGIKMKVGDAGNEIRKDVLETEAQQKLLRGMLKVEFQKMRDQMQSDMKQTREDVSRNEQS